MLFGLVWKNVFGTDCITQCILRINGQIWLWYCKNVH